MLRPPLIDIPRRVPQCALQVRAKEMKPVIETGKPSQTFPWRGRVVHVQSHRASKVRFDDSLNESTSVHEDYGDHCDDVFKFDVTVTNGDRIPKPILKATNRPGRIFSEIPRQSKDNMMKIPQPRTEDVAEVLKFLKKTNRVPRLAFSHKFLSAKMRPTGVENRLDNIVPYMLAEGYLEEKIYNELRNLEISRSFARKRLKLIPYRDEYEPSHCRGQDFTSESPTPVPKGTLLTGIARKVFSDNTVLMADASEPGRVVCGEQYEVMINGRLERIQCRKRLKGNCWQVLVLRSSTFDVVTEESIKRHINDISSLRLLFLGRIPVQDECFVAQVEAVKPGLWVVTLKEESFLSHLSIRTQRGSESIQLQARAIACRGELLLARPDLDKLVGSFGLSLADHVMEHPEVLFPLNEVQRFVLSTYKLVGFDHTDYITTSDLALLLDKGEDPDRVLVKELLLI